MPTIKPPVEQLYQFISETHLIEKIPVSVADAISTLTTNQKNWYADGHFAALLYSMDKICDSTDFPSRLPNIDNRYQSDQALHWVKTIYTRMMTPLALHPQPVFPGEQIQQEVIKASYLGSWRQEPNQNLYGPAPAPQLLPSIMHNWLIRLKSIHDNVKERLDTPYGIDKAQFAPMKAFVEEQPAFFSIVQPFQYANNRFGRLVENVIRLAWRMPFRYNVARGYETFKDSLEDYQAKTLPKIIQAAQQVR